MKMRLHRMVVALGVTVTVAGCAASDDRPRGARDTSLLTCTELADLRAAEQYQSDSAMLDDREAGLLQGSALSRDLIEMEAAAYRQAVYDECQKLRGQSDAGPTPVKPGS